jgi:hypothetical protein
MLIYDCQIGSVEGIMVPDHETYAYSASKAGLHHLSRTMGGRLGWEGITSNTIACGQCLIPPPPLSTRFMTEYVGFSRSIPEQKFVANSEHSGLLRSFLLTFLSSSDRMELQERVYQSGFDSAPYEGWKPGRRRRDGFVPVQQGWSLCQRYVGDPYVPLCVLSKWAMIYSCYDHSRWWFDLFLSSLSHVNTQNTR